MEDRLLLSIKISERSQAVRASRSIKLKTAFYWRVGKPEKLVHLDSAPQSYECISMFLVFKVGMMEISFFFFPPLYLVILSADNNNLSKWDASLGNSYMCRKEQTLEINENLQVHTFNLWVQPFLVKENKFSIGKFFYFCANSWNACKILTC